MVETQPIDSSANTGATSRFVTVVVTTAVGASLLWAFWPTFLELSRRWASDARYSHGYLVPLFSLWLLWDRRAMLSTIPDRCSWSGVPLIALGSGLHILGAYVYFEWLDAASLLICLAGLSVLRLGWRSLRWSWPAIGFLIFMLPLPHRLEIALGAPLQSFATRASAYIMQTLGMPAFYEGNVIILDDVRIGVVEACNGLGMMITFFAISTAVAMMIRRPWFDRLIVVLSAIPVAIFANVLRVAITGVLHRVADSETADFVFHDLAGWLMMPVALGVLWAELWILSTLLVEPEHPSPEFIPAES